MNLQSIREHLTYLDDCKDLFGNINQNVITHIPIKEKLISLKKRISKEKVFNYNANIISLYGYFEQYVEALIEEYVDMLITIVNQFDMNTNIVKNQFFDKWERLHNKISYPKYAHLTEEKLIQSLYEAKIGNKNHLIPEYYFQNGGNYKHSVICDCFKSLGMEDISQKIKYYDPLCSYFKSKGIFEQNEDILYEPLNDLVARRNDVAHGNNSDIIDLSYFKEYVEYVELYARTLNALLDDKLTELKWNNTKSSVINIKHLYNNHIVEIEVEDFVIEVGDTFLVREPERTYPRYTIRKVESIQKDDQPLPEFITYEKDTLTLGLSNNIKKNCKLKIVK